MNPASEPQMANPALRAAVDRYFDLMYDGDIACFDDVFLPTAWLHGLVGGKLVAWSASDYRQVLAARTPPRQVRAPRQQQVLLHDPVGDRQACVKVRVRIHDRVFVDHLCLLDTDAGWRISSKTFYLESEQVA